MWVWLGVGVAGYLALMCVVVLVLRAAKARNAAERAADFQDPETPWYAGPARHADDAEQAPPVTAAVEGEPVESEDPVAADDATETVTPRNDAAGSDVSQAGVSEAGVSEAGVSEAAVSEAGDADDGSDGDNPAAEPPPSAPDPRAGDDADAARAQESSTRPPHPGSLHR